MPLVRPDARQHHVFRVLAAEPVHGVLVTTRFEYVERVVEWRLRHPRDGLSVAAVVFVVAKPAHNTINYVIDRTGQVAGVVDRDRGRDLAVGLEVRVAGEPAAPRVGRPGGALRPVVLDPFLVVQLGDVPGGGRRLQVDDAVAGLIALVRGPDILEGMLSHLDGGADRLGQIRAADAVLRRLYGRSG